MSGRLKLEDASEKIICAIIIIFMSAFGILAIVLIQKDAKLPRVNTNITYTVISTRKEHHARISYSNTLKHAHITNYDDYFVEVQCNEDNHKETFNSKYLYNNYKEGDIIEGVITTIYNEDGSIKRKEYKYITPE